MGDLKHRLFEILPLPAQIFALQKLVAGEDNFFQQSQLIFPKSRFQNNQLFSHLKLQIIFHWHNRNLKFFLQLKHILLVLLYLLGQKPLSLYNLQQPSYNLLESFLINIQRIFSP